MNLSHRVSHVYKVVLVAMVLAAVFGMQCNGALAAQKHRIAWSHYTGWEPWAYAADSGILKKWADKYGIEIELVLVNDYVESINLYTGGQFDGCVMTNMDALTIPAVGGIDSTAVIVGDFSDGNDGIVVRNGTSVKDLKGRRVMLVELSVSHYLMARALEQSGLSERDVTTVNTSDADIAGLFLASKDPKAAVITWNPLLMQVRNAKGVNLVFDSSKIPGEIMDLMVVRTSAPDALKKALTGAWYETMAIMSGHSKTAKDAVQFMAKTAGGTEAEFRAQLRTTRMFYQAAEAVAFTKGPDVKKTMDYVRTFCFTHGLFGQGATSKDHVGVSFPDGSILGDPKNVKLRFEATYMEMAAGNAL
ncbi:putative urea ABC transporter substrate-binding protein [Syntrophobacter fumaroxidans]|uniref:ABC-type nitrate/sulfonate/bicarbonate transport system, periplasmic components n=1 Tax=Syntrophobacter fumaroxidans (strain DSM 10017 / MPOB) TaxID=335543 RepID=A0LP11_SYNFM|nr:putative urea ABC transporter substrate-binding protein [Syntrophobacter fumaroxidans]ABK19163.1 ABC-type nitrate/sulfonate/bicarbonate transport system, periplasmic components [Syntrophobacter fumaroxidans MPOB]